MTTFPGSPRLVKGGIVLIDAETSLVQRVIPLQYNPDTLSRTLQVQGMGESGDRSEALRLKGPPVETIKLEAEIDATDDLEQGKSTATDFGIHPQLAELETIIYPSSGHIEENNRLAQLGTLEITPMQAPLTLFIWSENRIMPVRITDFSITEEAFDTSLNPIRAKISLGMRVLNINDLGFDHKGGRLYLAYQRQKEGLAAKSQKREFSTLGIRGIPND